MDCFSFPSRLDSGAGGGVGFRPTGTDCPIVYCSPPSPQKRREIYQSTPPCQMLYKNKTTDVLIIFQVPPCSPPFFKNKNNNTSHFYVSLPTRSLRAIWRGKWSCFSWTIFRFRFQQLVFPTLWLFRTAAERANCRVRTLLCTGGVRTSTFLFWRSLRSVRAECRDELFIGTRPPAPSYNPCVTSVDVKRQGGNVSAPPASSFISDRLFIPHKIALCKEDMLRAHKKHGRQKGTFLRPVNQHSHEKHGWCINKIKKEDVHLRNSFQTYT